MDKNKEIKFEDRKIQYGNLENFPYKQNIREMLLYANSQNPDSTVYILKNQPEGLKQRYVNNSQAMKQILKWDKHNKNDYLEITMTEAIQDILGFGQALINKGYVPGDKVGVVSKNRYEWIISFLGIISAGLIVVPLDKGLPEGELASLVERSKIKGIVCEEKNFDIVKTIKDNYKNNLKDVFVMDYDVKDNILNVNENIISFYDATDSGIKTINVFKRVEKVKDTKYILDIEISGEELSILLFTSGTTGRAKGVMLTDKNVIVVITSVIKKMSLQPGERNYCFVPLHHILGCVVQIALLSVASPTCFTDGLRHLASNLVEYRIEIFVGVPALADGILKNIEAKIEESGKKQTVEKGIKIANTLRKIGIDIRRKLFKQVLGNFGGLRRVIVGGAPLKKSTHKAFRNMGIDLYQGYGLSETAPVISVETPDESKAGTAGKPIYEILELEIRDKNAEGTGEIVVRGDNVMLGYYENEDATKEVITDDGWFYTGDLGYLDEDGYLIIEGRKKDVIVLNNGKNVFPDEIEELVKDHELISECIVFGLPKRGDLQVSIKIVVDEDVRNKKYKDKTDAEIYDILWNYIKTKNKTMPTYKYIKAMILDNKAFEKTASGKVRRFIEIDKAIKEAEELNK